MDETNITPAQRAADLRKAASAVYLACEVSVAEDISSKLLAGADAIITLITGRARADALQRDLDRERALTPHGFERLRCSGGHEWIAEHETGQIARGCPFCPLTDPTALRARLRAVLRALRRASCGGDPLLHDPANAALLAEEEKD